MSVTFPIEFFLHQNKIQTVITREHAFNYPAKTVPRHLLKFSRNQGFDGCCKKFLISFLLSYAALRLSLVEEVHVQWVVTEKYAFKRQLKLFWITFWIIRTIITLMDQSNDLTILPCSPSQLWGFRWRTCCKKSKPQVAKDFDYEKRTESVRNAFAG